MADMQSHCRDLVRAADPDRFLATLFAPAAHRDALLALYAFDIELARVRHAVREPMAGEVRLQWWREVVAGERLEEARGHPVASALLDVVKLHALPLSSFEEMIEGRHRDLVEDAIRTPSELENYCRQTSSALMGLAARILDQDIVPDALAFAEPAGIALGLVGLLRAERVLSIDQSDIRALAAEHYRRALPLIAAAPRNVVAAWLPVALVPSYLRTGQNAVRPAMRATGLSSLRKVWIFWQAARRGRPVPL